ncbi:hypothetical protein [Xanthomonas euvesicatoria]|uniref:hypothetical protein n=1 Tax=Xanthomonas euvesicatoria TaxID=456327 RepID=UPI001C455E42|nr:hypothetical protein [Xanthomonas euvesicatoria]MBV6790635.1 hypothetical protein [Xanthomonas campestris pv. clerodendri]
MHQNDRSKVTDLGRPLAEVMVYPSVGDVCDMVRDASSRAIWSVANRSSQTVELSNSSRASRVQSVSSRNRSLSDQYGHRSKRSGMGAVQKVDSSPKESLMHLHLLIT